MDPARSIILELVHDGKNGKIELTFDEWDGTRIGIAFRDRLYRNSGVIQFDGQTGRSVINSFHPYSGLLSDPHEFDSYFASILKTFANAFTFGWSPAPESMVAYDAGYHESNNYTRGDPNEIEIKSVQAKIIAGIADPGKCVIAGCSNGELVRQCRAIGINAYGFDVIPNVREIAFPEVREFLTYGSLTAIPYRSTDTFDTLVAIDVLEHIPERDLPQMTDEWLRIGVSKLVLLINLNQFWFPGHITLRPLLWWADRFQPRFKHVRTTRQFPHLPSVYSNVGQYNQQWTLWEDVTWQFDRLERQGYRHGFNGWAANQTVLAPIR